jgi:hypothetical protein
LVKIATSSAKGSSVESTEIIGIKALKPLTDFCRRARVMPDLLDIQRKRQAFRSRI